MESVAAKSEDLIKITFPQKIADLSKLLDSPEFDTEAQEKLILDFANIPAPGAEQNISVPGNGNSTPDDEDSSDERASKKRKLSTSGRATVPCNEVICRLVGIVRPLVREFMEHTNLVRSPYILH